MSFRYAALWLVITGCGTNSSDVYGPSVSAEAPMERAPEAADGVWEQEMSGDYDGGPIGGLANNGDAEDARGRRASPVASVDAIATRSPGAAPPPPPGDAQKGGGAGADVVASEDVRRWFPEAFLWQPLVETSDDGVATLDVTVPDQLTTWRVLALAHDRRGQQAGAVHTFASTLDLYVDPVTPAWLYAGDVVDLPVQVANTTDRTVAQRLTMTSSGALRGDGVADVSVPAYGTVVRTLRVTTEGAGPARVRTDLGSVDAAERVVPVQPTGRPVEAQRGGIVAGTRTFAMAPPQGADPSTEELSVLVFPGPLAVVTAEVERAGNVGVDPASAAYGFGLASRLSTLSAAGGHDLDADVIRRLQLSSWQRVVRYGRAPDVGVATDLLLAMADVRDHALAEGMRDRLIRVVADGQRGDGTWSRAASSTLQRVLVETSIAARALPVSETTARLRASGALERFGSDIDDPFTAAVALSSGVVEGDLRDELAAQVVAGLVIGEGGTTVAVPEGVLNAWGVRPTRGEMLAFTALALTHVDQPEHVGDLISELMSGYDAERGFGARAADILALDAVLAALPALDQAVTLSLFVNGAAVASAPLDPSQPMVPALLTAAPNGAAGEVELRVSPAVPGLSFVATRRSWVPWSGDEALDGFEVEVKPPAWHVGVDGRLVLSVSGVANEAVTIEQGLPAGATVDEEALRALHGSVLVDSRVDAHRVVLTTRRMTAGEVLEIPLVIRPAFAGTFSTAPLLLSDANRSWMPSVAMKPVQWRVL